MNSLKPENVIFVPKNRGMGCFLSCFTSLIILILGIVLMFVVYSIINL